MSTSKVTSSARPWVSWTADGLAHEQVEAQQLGRGRVLVAPGQLGQVGHQSGQLLELHEHVVDQHRTVVGAELVDAADHLEVGAQAGERGP